VWPCIDSPPEETGQRPRGNFCKENRLGWEAVVRTGARGKRQHCNDGKKVKKGVGGPARQLNLRLQPWLKGLSNSGNLITSWEDPITGNFLVGPSNRPMKRTDTDGFRKEGGLWTGSHPLVEVRTICPELVMIAVWWVWRLFSPTKQELPQKSPSRIKRRKNRRISSALRGLFKGGLGGPGQGTITTDQGEHHSTERGAKWILNSPHQKPQFSQGINNTSGKRPELGEKTRFNRLMGFKKKNEWGKSS